MDIGFMVEPQAGGTYRRLRELAQWAEDAGFAVFARSDHYLNMDESVHATDALTTLAGLAAETERIRLMPMVSPITFHHPSRLAKVAGTLDEMSGGRFALGVGTGWMESEHEAFGLELPPLRERFERLEETLAYLRAAFTGDGGFAGAYYRLAPIAVLPQPTDCPVVVGGQGMKKTPTLAGRYADEYNMFAVGADTLEARLAVMRESAIAAGRDPGDILVSFATPAFLTETEAAHGALIAQRAEAAGRSPEEYLELIDGRNFVHGTPQRAAETLHRIAEMGVGRVYLQSYAHLDDIDTGLFRAALEAYRG